MYELNDSYFIMFDPLLLAIASIVIGLLIGAGILFKVRKRRKYS